MVICYAFSKCHDKGANLLTFSFLELKQLAVNKEQYLFYQILDQPTPKRTTLAGFVGTYIYVDKI